MSRYTAAHTGDDKSDYKCNDNQYNDYQQPQNNQQSSRYLNPSSSNPQQSSNNRYLNHSSSPSPRRRVTPPSTAHRVQRSEPKYDSSLSYAPSVPYAQQQQQSIAPSSYSGPTQIRHSHYQQSRPPPSRSSVHSNKYYPEYTQHQIRQDDEKNNANQPQKYAKTEQFQNYQYNQRHNSSKSSNDDEKKMYPQSDQAHYRGPNRREIRADPYSLQPISSQLPRRPNRPYIARPNDANDLTVIDIRSNQADIKLMCENLIKYDIEFDPYIAEDAKELRKRAIKLCERQIRDVYGFFFDDNTRLYALKSVEETHRFSYQNQKQIILKFGQNLRVQDLDLQYKKQIQGIILQKLLSKANLQRFGRGHYDMNKQARLPIRGPSDFNRFPKNLSLIPGYRTSLETTVNGMMIGVDTCHRLIEDRTVQEFMDTAQVDVENAHPNQGPEYIIPRFREFVKSHLCGRHVQLFTNGKLIRIDDIDFTLSINSLIPRHPQNLTIKAHWERLYDVELLDESVGIIVHFSKQRKNERTNQVQFIPPEICCMTGVDSDHRGKRSVTTGISKATKIPSHHRLRSANNLVKKLSKITETHRDLKQFVQFPNNRTKDIKGQILQCPKVLLSKDDTKKWMTGPEMLQHDWKECSFMEKGDKISDWAIVYHCAEQESATLFVKSLKEYAINGGFKKAVDENKLAHIVIPNNDQYTWKNTLNRRLNEINGYNLRNNGNLIKCIVAIIPHFPQKLCDRVYVEIKQICSVKRAILSQCILSKHTSKTHVINGVLRQLLIKLGAIPWKIQFDLPHKRLDIVNTPTMVVGINVNHAQKCNTSTVGFAASYDYDFVRYFTLVIHQRQNQELSNKRDLKPVIEQALENFHKINQCYPRQIIVYRDGISSTQIEDCTKTEVAAFKEVLGSDPYSSQNPKLEFIAVNKRVIARFLISNNLQSAPPGTMINDVVVSNQFWDFFLVPSKPPPNCVAIPTRCIVIVDELGLSDNDGKGEVDLCDFTNALCSLYFNWPGPTRVPAPIKYAQKIAQQFCQTLSQKHPHHLLHNSYHFL